MPIGLRQDTRWRTRHLLRPTEAMVTEFLAAPSGAAWAAFRRTYLNLLEKRFKEDRGSFDELASVAGANNVFLGCSCPTKLNPRINHCHTFLALLFIKQKYPSLLVRPPEA